MEYCAMCIVQHPHFMDDQKTSWVFVKRRSSQYKTSASDYFLQHWLTEVGDMRQGDPQKRSAHDRKHRFPFQAPLRRSETMEKWSTIPSGGLFFLSMAITQRDYIQRMRSSLVVRASDCQCTSCNDPSIRRHSGTWGAADEAVLNIVQNKKTIY